MEDFTILEATIASVQTALRQKDLSVRELVQAYLQRIEALDRAGPKLNSIISVNPRVLAEADDLDAQFAATNVMGPLHGVVFALKDQVDIAGMPTTLGSVLFDDHVPNRDAHVIKKIKDAGGIFIAKTTLGEFGAGDAHGSLFGSTRNVFDIERTAGGSSGGSAVAVSANLCTVAIGQEGFASIRRPAAWNGISGMRPTAGFVGRGGVYNGWPTVHGALGPMARRVEDIAKVLDQIVGYDSEDPLSSYASPYAGSGFAPHLDAQHLRGARLGVIRETLGYESEPQGDDFQEIDAAFERSLGELRSSGAVLIDPIQIPDLANLLAMRARPVEEEVAAYERYFARTPNARFKTRDDAMASDRFRSVWAPAQTRWKVAQDDKRHDAYLKARDLLMTNVLQVMAENKLDAIVHKAVEHQPTLIRDGLKPPFTDQKGAIHLNTFLVFVPAAVVPAGLTPNGLPTGLTFLGRPYDDAKVLSLAYSYQENTSHRTVPLYAP